MLFFSFLTMSLVLAHMKLTNPAPRRSKHNSGYKDIDYDMTSPLGGRFSYPCRGFPEGPVSKKYTAGKNFTVTLGGSATHGGGHCQFAMSFDGQDFVVIQTELGTCLKSGKSFPVQIPKNFPSGRAVFAWVWNNRVGNREMYMNCADIEITGGSGTSYTGPELLIANFNVPGKKVHRFPAGFADDFGKELFAAQPKITIASSNTNAYQPATDQGNEIDTGDQQDRKGDKNKSAYPTTPDTNPEKPSDDKPSYMPGLNDKKQPESPNNPDADSDYNTPKSKDKKHKSKKGRYPRDTSKQNPTLPEADYKPSIVPEPDYDVQPSEPIAKKQSVQKDLSAEKCVHGMSYCKGSNMIGTCVWGGITFTPCSQGSTCHEAQPGQAHC
ncbi:hypothetical protein DSO57_1002332 [Entomophthora muscae]|uniref:Uncharacterized protein n=1 Tax=Entomophthora muscae TaxID=34485 RepID=A0ACC2UIR1_9FUNG|nr:hypothetical protein DSO57_1002332 [Entomophthora muscae]